VRVFSDCLIDDSIDDDDRKYFVATLAAWAGTRQRTTDVLARHQEHRALLFIEREPRANIALAAASRVVQMNSTMLLLWAGQGRDELPTMISECHLMSPE
jgi:hypothetical protein